MIAFAHMVFHRGGEKSCAPFSYERNVKDAFVGLDNFPAAGVSVGSTEAGKELKVARNPTQEGR